MPRPQEFLASEQQSGQLLDLGPYAYDGAGNITRIGPIVWAPSLAPAFTLSGRTLAIIVTSLAFTGLGILGLVPVTAKRATVRSAT